MLNLARNGYTAAQVQNALNAATGVRTVNFRYDLLSSANSIKKSLLNVNGAGITYDSTANVQRTLKCTMLDDQSIQWGSDRIKPYVRLRMPDNGYAEFPAGVFLLSTPTQAVDEKSGQIVRSISGYDLMQVVTDNRTTDRYAVAAGTVYTAAIATLLSTAGFMGANINITVTTATLPATQEWPAGTTLLTIINTLLAAIAYDSLWFDVNGVAQVAPTVLPTVKPSTWTYTNDGQSVLIPDMQRTYDLFAIPNTFVLVVSDPSRATSLRSVYVNSNPLSPTSTVARGRTITSFDSSQQAPDQTTLDTLAKNAAFAASQIYESLTFSTLIMPMHEHLDVITINQGNLGVSAMYQEIGWSYNLQSGSAMQHKVKRIVAV